MKASTLSFQAAVLLLLVGMGWGLAMAISGDHSTFPGHAHLNLLGWVSLFLFGIFYHLHPALNGSRIALVHIWVWIVATVIMVIGVGLVHGGYPEMEAIPAVGSLLVFGDTAYFAWIVFRRAEAPRITAPAE